MYSDVQVGVKILWIGYFFSSNVKLWIGFQLFVYYCCVIKYFINMIIFQIDKGILIIVIRDSFYFWVLILNIFLVCSIVFYFNMFVFQIGKCFVGIFFGNYDG